jgi:hypothetical protein
VKLGWLVLVAACSKSAPEEDTLPPALLSPGELQRADDACKAYVEKVCACATAVPAKQEDCTMSKMMPEGIEVAKRLAANPKADREDSVQAASSVRKTVKQCIERTAKLPSEGCP